MEDKEMFLNMTLHDLVAERDGYMEQVEELQQENKRLNNLLKQLVGEEKNWQINNGQDRLEKLQQEKEELIKWLEEMDMVSKIQSKLIKLILSKLKGDE